ncbi:MAG: glucosamine-6-phosphate deaminase [Oscillospiraceae bacterium]|nr:glucosamine-6-phosphate deaminase [Oscillospiraceae bacterium]
MTIHHVSNYAEMCRKAANMISAQILLNPTCTLGLATGSTPIGIYERLADAYNKSDLDFSGITTFNLDEYCGLSENDPQGYYYYMNEQLFNKVNIDRAKAHVPNGTAGDIALECRRYEALITAAGGIDLQLLGIGNNGHIGFNEPSSAFEKDTHCVELDEETIIANARFFDNPDDVPRRAITMGIGTIMQAKKILLVANGEKKKEILQKALYGPITPMVPASILQLHPDLTVIWSDT